MRIAELSATELQPFRRWRLGRLPLFQGNSVQHSGRLVGSEIHEAPHFMTIRLSMFATRGTFTFNVGFDSVVHSGRWLPITNTLRSLVGAELSKGVRLVAARKHSAIAEYGNSRLSLQRAGLTGVVVTNVDDGRTVARLRSIPNTRSLKSFLEVDRIATAEEVSIVVVAMASGIVLMLRPLARFAVVHWPFAWQRPVLSRHATRRRWMVLDSGGDILN